MSKMTHNELAALSPSERANALQAMEAEILYNAQPWSTPAINSTLRSYEDRFGMSTSEMLAKFAAGEMADDGEISSWLFWARAASRTRVVR
jgi:hypothetical protein